jgi:predicted nucleic acid-binding protein
MIFIDSNIFLHAFLVPRRKLTEKEERVKKDAKAIISRLEGGEEAAMTASHLSEVLNIIETGLGLDRSLGFLAWVSASENLKVMTVAMQDYEEALPVAKEERVGPNDALAYVFMRREGIEEVYSFDKHFDRFKDMIRRRE